MTDKELIKILTHAYGELAEEHLRRHGKVKCDLCKTFDKVALASGAFKAMWENKQMVEMTREDK